MIGKYFSIEELTASTTADRLHIENAPSPAVVDNLTALVTHILDPLRQAIGRPVIVTSGYRSHDVNAAVGGAADSQHTLGQAADIHVDGYTIEQLMAFIKARNLPYDQLINEFSNWVHVSYSSRNRRQELIATHVNGHAVYTPAH